MQTPAHPRATRCADPETPMNRHPIANRPFAPHCHGGASSLLRLSSGATGHWPSVTKLTDWAARLALPAEPAPAPMAAPSPDAASPLFTRLWPSGTSKASEDSRLAA